MTILEAASLTKEVKDMTEIEYLSLLMFMSAPDPEHAHAAMEFIGEQGIGEKVLACVDYTMETLSKAQGL